MDSVKKQAPRVPHGIDLPGFFNSPIYGIFVVVMWWWVVVVVFFGGDGVIVAVVRRK